MLTTNSENIGDKREREEATATHQEARFHSKIYSADRCACPGAPRAKPHTWPPEVEKHMVKEESSSAHHYNLGAVNAEFRRTREFPLAGEDIA